MITVDRKLLEAALNKHGYYLAPDEIAAVIAALSEPQGRHKQTDRCGFDRNASHSEGRYVCLCESTIDPHGETPETDALWVDDVEIPSVKKVTELCRSLERRLHAAENDARQNMSRADFEELQFWRESNRRYYDRKDHVTGMSLAETIYEIRSRAAAIDAEIDK